VIASWQTRSTDGNGRTSCGALESSPQIWASTLGEGISRE
jgi:hypothetical protein